MSLSVTSFHDALFVERQRAMSSFLKYFEDAHNICFFSYKVMDFGQMVLRLEYEASDVGLKVNSNKRKFLTLTGHRSFYCICINGQNIEGVDELIYTQGLSPLTVVPLSAITELNLP